MGKKIEMYQRPDGLYEKKVTINGKRVAFRAKSPQEVLKKIVEYQGETERGPLFETAADAWYKEQEARFERGVISFNTLASYKPAKDNARDYFAGQRIKSVLPQDCDRYAKYLAKRFDSQKTVSNKLSVLHCILDFSCVEYNLPYNPSDKVKLPDGLKRSFRDLPPQEHITSLKTKIPEAGTDEFIGWLFCYVALHTGARRGEIVPMRMGWNIDCANSEVHIRKAIYFYGNQAVEKETKSVKGVRDIVLMDDLKEQLNAMGFKAGELLFSWQGKMLTAMKLKSCLDKYYTWSGNHSTPHQYRHGFITVCFEAGIDAKVIQEMAGHAQLSTTMNIYTHLRRNKLSEAGAKLNSIDFATGKQKKLPGTKKKQA